MNTAAPTIRIAVANAREIYRDALATLLSTQPGFAVVARTSDASDLVRQVRDTRPNVLLMERDEPEALWLSRLQAVSRVTMPPKSVLLCDNLPQQSLLQGIEAGLRGIVAQDAPAEMLFKSIRCVSAGEYWMGRERVADVMEYLRQKKKTAAPDNQFGLTEREMDVVSELLTGASNKEIAQVLTISSQAVRHHLCSIFEKVGATNRLELALFAIHHGIGCRATTSETIRDPRKREQ